jgi:hypothetical protein
MSVFFREISYKVIFSKLVRLCVTVWLRFLDSGGMSPAIQIFSAFSVTVEAARPLPWKKLFFPVA